MAASNFTQKTKGKGRAYTSRGDTSLDKFNSSNGQVYGTLTLDTRRALDSGLYPAAVRVAFDGKNIYLRIGKQFALDDWTDLCECEKQARNKRLAERKELKAQMDKVVTMVNKLVEDGNFSLSKLKLMYQVSPTRRIPSIPFGMLISGINVRAERLVVPVAARTSKSVSSVIWVRM